MSVPQQIKRPAERTSSGPSLQDEIRARAYELFQQRGGEDGHDAEDWLRAEDEIISRNMRSRKAA